MPVAEAEQLIAIEAALGAPFSRGLVPIEKILNDALQAPVHPDLPLRHAQQ